MSVYIKGMDKPKNCFGCDFNMYDCYCKLNHGGIDKDFWFCETECPISDVPAPHGRLIDVDEIMSNFPKANIKGDDYANMMAYPHWRIGISGLITILLDATTVIEADSITGSVENMQRSCEIVTNQITAAYLESCGLTLPTIEAEETE